MKTKQNWEKEFVEPVLKKVGERRDRFSTTSDIEVERLYTPSSISKDYLENLGFPGTFPFTRGIYPTGYRSRFWTMRQYAGFGDAESSNKRYRYLLSQGQTGLSIAFDLPTQIGYDSDDSHSEGEVGKVGVAIDSLNDMEILFDSIDLEKVSTSMTINSTAAVLLAMYIALAKKRGNDLSKISGTIQNDILKEYIARGTYIYPPSPSMRIIRDIFSFCSENVPKWNTISVSGYHIREAGSTAAQEVAFTLADGISYVETAIKSGLDIDKFAPRISFFFGAHNDLFEEAAKFRAARRLWAKITKTRFAPKNPRSTMLRFHTQTCGSTLTAQQPINNIIRVTIQALSAVLGGTQSLHTNSFDEALALPTEDSARTALRTQQVIAYESKIADTLDPLAGSYYVESLTDQMEKKASDYIDKIDTMGGMVKAIENGFPQREIQNASYEYQKKIESLDEIIVGVNKFKINEKKPTGLLKIDESLAKKQIEKLDNLRKTRDNRKIEHDIKMIKEAAKDETKNLMPPIIEAVSDYMTIGEISNTLRDIFGEYQEQVVI